MEGKFCLKTTTRVCMNDSLEIRRQTKQHIVAHARTVLGIFHQSINQYFHFLNQYAENDVIKN